MSLTIWQVDAFSDEPFRGNPAAVCILPAAREAAWMQALACEMNLSETAFLLRREAAEFTLCWFTPTVEIDLCGHATLASAHVLWQEGFLRPDQAVRFHTRSGALLAHRDGDWIELDFPSDPPLRSPLPEAVLRGLGARATYTGTGKFDYFAELEGEAELRALAPDFGALASAGQRGVIVTARASTAPFDFVCRFFAPAAGINEDPVTGSAQCALGPYWQERLGKDELLGYQASARGGVVRVRPRRDRVLIAGKAVTVLKGELIE